MNNTIKNDFIEKLGSVETLAALQLASTEHSRNENVYLTEGDFENHRPNSPCRDYYTRTFSGSVERYELDLEKDGFEILSARVKEGQVRERHYSHENVNGCSEERGGKNSIPYGSVDSHQQFKSHVFHRDEFVSENSYHVKTITYTVRVRANNLLGKPVWKEAEVIVNKDRNEALSGLKVKWYYNPLRVLPQYSKQAVSETIAELLFQ